MSNDPSDLGERPGGERPGGERPGELEGLRCALMAIIANDIAELELRERRLAETAKNLSLLLEKPPAFGRKEEDLRQDLAATTSDAVRVRASLDRLRVAYEHLNG